MQESSDQPRFGHLIYTSDREGFGVKDSCGEWTPEELSVIRQYISPTEGYGVEISSTYSPERDEPLPRRMVWSNVGESAMGLWHSVPVQPDFTGRKASVFAQCLIDRRPGHPAGSRPIDWWGSPDIQRPYFVNDYSTARLAVRGEPSPGPDLTKDHLYLFFTAQGHLIRNLLDAVYAAMHGGPTVVLGTTSQAAAALAVGVVSHLMSPQVARTLRFSLLETTELGGASDSFMSAVERGLDLIALPMEHFETLAPDERWLLISEFEARPEPESVGDVITLSNGQSLTVTPWSVLAWAIFEWGSSADFDALDRYSAMLTEPDVDQAVPLAMMAAAASEQSGSVRALASQVLMDHGPEDTAALPTELWMTLRTAIQYAAGQSLDDAATTLAGLRRGGSAESWVLQTYLERLLAIPAAVLDRDRSAPGQGFRFPAQLLEELVEKVEAEADRLGIHRGAYLLRFADHLVQMGLRSEPRDPVPGVDTYRELCRTEAHAIARGALIEAVGPLSELTAATFVRPVVIRAWEEGDLEVPSPLPPEIYEWLWPEGVDSHRVNDGLHFAAAYTGLLESPGGEPDPALRLELMYAALAPRSTGPPLVADACRRDVVTELVTMGPLSAGQLRLLRDSRILRQLPEVALLAVVLQGDYPVLMAHWARDALRELRPMSYEGMHLQVLMDIPLENLLLRPDVWAMNSAARAGADVLRAASTPVGGSLAAYLVAVLATGSVVLTLAPEGARGIPELFDGLDELSEALLPLLESHSDQAHSAVVEVLRRVERWQPRNLHHTLVMLDARASGHWPLEEDWPHVMGAFTPDRAGQTLLGRALMEYLVDRNLDEMTAGVARYVDTLWPHEAGKAEKALISHWRRCGGQDGLMVRLLGKGTKKSVNEHQEDY